jgi:rRNA maturation endonuclease Nob1
MTEQEAVKKIKDILEEATSYENAVCYVTPNDEMALKMAINALEFEQNFKNTIGENIEDAYIAIMRKDGVYEINGVDIYDAVEKQIPKKVVTEKGETFALTKDGKESYLFRYRCPSCNRIIRFFEANNFCMFCGQAVDWSEEE